MKFFLTLATVAVLAFGAISYPDSRALGFNPCNPEIQKC